jgi:predicted nucleic acid-binding protein
MNNPASPKPKVFIDADVLFAGSASPTEHGASLMILRLAELTLLEAITSEQVIIEVERNLTAKLPAALPVFRLLVSRCLQVVSDPQPAEIRSYTGLADQKDLPILVAAVLADSQWLITFNERHFQPGYSSVVVLRPGAFVLRIRYLLAQLVR